MMIKLVQFVHLILFLGGSGWFNFRLGGGNDIETLI